MIDCTRNRPDRYSPPVAGVGLVGSMAGLARLLDPSTTAIELRYEFWPLVNPFVPRVTSLTRPASWTCPFSEIMSLAMVKCGTAVKFLVTV